MPYQPGLHIIAELSIRDVALLNQYEPSRQRINQLIQQFGLQNLGEVYHNFSPAGFTGVVCLSESHLSLHSWPEYGRLHLDVYLSNFNRNNDATTTAIFEALVSFYDATILQQQRLVR